LLVSELLFPIGLANVAKGHSTPFSKILDLCNRKYQGRGPENCKNIKFVTNCGEWNFLNVTICNVT
jgi:hypothetical protein